MTKLGAFTLYNVDRQLSACFGGDPSDEDHCVVYKDGVTLATNPLTGKPQPSIVYSGRLVDCYAWIREQTPTSA